MLHRKCKTPISYKLFCEEGDEVQKNEIAFGYRLKGHDYLVLNKGEIISANLCFERPLIRSAWPHQEGSQKKRF
jgi:non-homologous end joining protein Ku